VYSSQLRSDPDFVIDRHVMSDPSSLSSFLRAEKNSKSREFLLTSRVIHDLMVAAASRNYDLLVYAPTVDSDGFDLILDDRDTFLPLQLKSVISGGRATEWAIHRKLLRPAPHQIEWFGFEPSPSGEGRGGGVLLIEVKANDNTADVVYRYTDLRILTAYWLGLITITPRTKQRLDRLRNELSEHPSGKVDVPRTAFLKARSPEHLLALAGLHSRFSTSWPHLLYQLARHTFEGRDLPMPEARIRSLIEHGIQQLVE
jgi:hypothetical protein